MVIWVDPYVGREVYMSPEDQPADSVAVQIPVPAATQSGFSEQPRWKNAGDWPIVWPLIALVLMSLIIRNFAIDQQVSERCYDPVGRIWPLETAQPWLWFYRNGTIPPLLIGITGALVFIFGSSLLPRADSVSLNGIRRQGLFLALLLLIGPGLIVNSSLKMLWGRPRPLQCEQFGGEMTFLPVGEWGTRDLPNSSFPSGHAAVAFFLMGLGFICNPAQLYWQRGLFLGGIAYGLAMGLTRVLQGGHFVSDVLWAGAIDYFVAVTLWKILIRNDSAPQLLSEQKLSWEQKRLAEQKRTANQQS